MCMKESAFFWSQNYIPDWKNFSVDARCQPNPLSFFAETCPCKAGFEKIMSFSNL